ncbi:MAG: hypothetical protein KUG77_10380 [Nannocystaceae bacterium]|nr:hypothetical protein [Nannocystaceae bacterium]
MRGLALLPVFTAVVACGSPAPLPPEKIGYAGTWEGDGVRLQISADARVSYDRKKGAGNEHTEGPIAGWVGDDFVVGVMTQKTTFAVDTPPHEDAGTWTMVVNGDTVYRLAP